MWQCNKQIPHKTNEKKNSNSHTSQCHKNHVTMSHGKWCFSSKLGNDSVWTTLSNASSACH